MNKLIKIIYPLITLLCITGCNEYNLFDESKDQIAGIDYPTTETGDGYTITYKFNESTIVYDNNSINYVHHIEQDSILYFDINTPADYLPSVGSVLSAPVTELTPFGLGNKVISITNTGQYLKCTTTSAPLNEIFEVLSFVYETEDISSLADSMEVFDIENNQWIKLNSQNQKTRVSEDKEIAPITMKFPSLTKKGMSLKGGVEITGKFHAEGDISDGTFDFYFEPAITFKGSAGVELEYNKNIWQDIDEFEHPFYRAKKVNMGAVTLGPLVLHPYISAEGYFDFNASGSVFLDFEQKFGFRGGYGQAKGGYMNSTSSDFSDFIKDISINGNVGFKLKGVFDIGIGVYIKDVAAEIDPYFSVSIGTDFRSEALKDNASLDCRLNFDVNGGMDAKIVVNLWGILHLMPEVNIVDFNIFHCDWPLIPIYEENTLAVVGTGTPGSFEGNYIITGAPLAKFWPIIPCINIYDKDHKLIQRKELEGPQICTTDHFVRFNLTGLADGDYYIHPCIIYRSKDGKDLVCESEEEYKITSGTTVQILEIRQTGYSVADHDCGDGCGVHFDKLFSYDVDIKVAGSGSCVECGYCAQYIHDRWVYYSVPKSDGVHTISGSVLFNSDNPRFIIYPYIKHSNGNIEIGDPFATQFSGSRSRKSVLLKSKHVRNNNCTLSHPLI